MSKPLVSIVIATLNRSQDLLATLHNIAKQDYAHTEVIVINDGSTDDTAQVLAGLPGITLITNPQRLGLQKSLNIGCRAAKGKYIARIDDHDIWTDPTKLSKQIAKLEDDDHIGLIGTAFTIGQRTFINPLTDKDIRRQILFRCPFSHVTVVFRKDLFELVGGYDETLRYSEDWDLWLRMGLKSQLLNLGDITTDVKESGAGSLTDTFYVSQWQQNKLMLQKYYQSYPRMTLAYMYHVFVNMFFKLVKKGSWPHRFFTKIYTLFFSAKKQTS